jgi:hypothetical protein
VTCTSCAGTDKYATEDFHVESDMHVGSDTRSTQSLAEDFFPRWRLLAAQCYEIRLFRFLVIVSIRYDTNASSVHCVTNQASPDAP